MNIAVFLPNWVGDVVMATPALRALRQRFPRDRLVGVCKPYVAGVLEAAPWLDATVFLDRAGAWSVRWPAVAWRLRAEKLVLAVLFANTFRAALVAAMAGATRRVGFNRHGRGAFLTDALESARDDTGRFKPTPILDDYNRLVQAVDCPPPGRLMQLFTTAADERAADLVWEKFRLREKREVISLNPGAAFGSSKHWPTQSFARLAQYLVDRRDCKVLVLCGPGERDMAREIATLAGRADVHSLAAEPLSLGLTKALVRRATLLATTDSGPRHFAAAFDRPVVTLFGPTHIAWTETYFPRAKHLQEAVPCGPCQKRLCTTDHACMQLLTPEKVFAAVGELLSRPGTVPLPLAPPERKAS
jgi:heptosyltransferase-2